MSKTCFIVAGPNGAGKTTFAEKYLPVETGCYNFINTDLVAAGLSPFRPEAAAIEAGRIVLDRIEALVRAGHTFAIESTLSGLTHVGRLRRLKAKGYEVVILYLKLPDVRAAIERVHFRVRLGGHAVDETDIKRRYTRSWENFLRIYRTLADRWVIYDNSGEKPVIVEESE